MRNIIKNILKEEFDSKSDRVKYFVNKYGIDQAIKLVAGGVDTIRQAYQNNPLSFLNQFNNLTPVETDDRIYYEDKDGNPLFMYYPNRKNEVVYIHYGRIWMFFSDVLELRSSEIQNIINKWLEETYNLTELTPVSNRWITL